MRSTRRNGVRGARAGIEPAGRDTSPDGVTPSKRVQHVPLADSSHHGPARLPPSSSGRLMDRRSGRRERNPQCHGPRLAARAIGTRGSEPPRALFRLRLATRRRVRRARARPLHRRRRTTGSTYTAVADAGRRPARGGEARGRAHRVVPACCPFSRRTVSGVRHPTGTTSPRPRWSSPSRRRGGRDGEAQPARRSTAGRRQHSVRAAARRRTGSAFPAEFALRARIDRTLYSVNSAVASWRRQGRRSQGRSTSRPAATTPREERELEKILDMSARLRQVTLRGDMPQHDVRKSSFKAAGGG